MALDICAQKVRVVWGADRAGLEGPLGQDLQDRAKPAWRRGKDGCHLEQKLDRSHNGGELQVSAAATPSGF